LGPADPGSNMVVSLQYMNKDLLTLRPNFENDTSLDVMKFLLDKINKEFLNVHTLIEEKSKITYT